MSASNSKGEVSHAKKKSLQKFMRIMIGLQENERLYVSESEVNFDQDYGGKITFFFKNSAESI